MNFRRMTAAGLAAVGLFSSALVVSSTAQAAPAATLCLYNLKVVTTEDWSGADEVYLRKGTTTIWGPRSLNDGQTGAVRVNVATGSIIAAWDQDNPSAGDSHDWIGSNTIDRTGTYVYSGDGARYELSVRSSC